MRVKLEKKQEFDAAMALRQHRNAVLREPIPMKVNCIYIGWTDPFLGRSNPSGAMNEGG
jgi:hypothetical protein